MSRKKSSAKTRRVFSAFEKCTTHLPEFPYFLTEHIFRHLSGGEFALAFINLSEAETTIHCELVDLGLPVSSGFALFVKDVYTGEDLGKKSDYFNQKIPGHDMRLYLCRLVKK